MSSLVAFCGFLGSVLSVIDIVEEKDWAWPLLGISLFIGMVGVVGVWIVRRRITPAIAADAAELSESVEGELPYGIAAAPEGLVVRNTKTLIVVMWVMSVLGSCMAVLGFVTESGGMALALLVFFGVYGIVFTLFALRASGPQLVIAVDGLTKMTWPQKSVRWQMVTAMELKHTQVYVSPAFVSTVHLLVTAPGGVERPGGTRRGDTLRIPLRALEARPSDVLALATAQWGMQASVPHPVS